MNNLIPLIFARTRESTLFGFSVETLIFLVMSTTLSFALGISPCIAQINDGSFLKGELTSVNAAVNSTPLSAQTNGLEFGSSLMPTRPGELINSNNANSTSWSGVNNSTKLPEGLGAFSRPNNGSGFTGNGYQGGLSVLGIQAQKECLNYKPTGDLAQDQYCAAINFMAGRCIQTNSLQNQVINATGINTSNFNPAVAAFNSDSCLGSMGQGAKAYNFADVSSTNSKNPLLDQFQRGILSATSVSLPDTQCSALSDNYQSKSTISPALYSTSTCWISSPVSAYTCSQTLGVQVTQQISPPIESASCSSGQLVGGICQTSTIQPPQNNKSCPTGFLINGGQCTQTINLAASTNPSCPAGGVWSSSLQNCELTTQVISKPTQSFADCPSGTTLQSGACVQMITQPAQLMAATCGSNQTLQGTNCIHSEITSSSAIQGLSCPNNSVIVGSQCVQITTTHALPVYECPSGSYLSGQTCTGTATLPMSPQLSCKGFGTLSSYLPPNMPYQCLRVATRLDCSLIAYLYTLSDVNRDSASGQSVCVLGPVLVESCPVGTQLINTVCQQNIISVATVGSYSCSTGTLQGQNCNVSTYSQAQITYTCPVQSQLVNTNGSYICSVVTTITQPAVLNYSCSIGYSLTGTICNKVLSNPAAVNYSCALPAYLSNMNCISQSNTITKADMNYFCAAGFSLSANLCTQNITSPAIVNLSCLDGATLNTGTELISPTCTTTITSLAQLNQSCSVGSVLTNSSCIQQIVKTNWTDGCAIYEQSAGQLLSTPL